MLIINGVTHVPTELYLLCWLHNSYIGSIKKNTRGRTNRAFHHLPSRIARRNFKILPLENAGLFMWTWQRATPICLPIKQVSVRSFWFQKTCLLSKFIDELMFCVEKNVWTSVLPDDELQVFVMKSLNLRIHAYWNKHFTWGVLRNPEKAESTTMMSLSLKGAVFPVTCLWHI